MLKEKKKLFAKILLILGCLIIVILIVFFYGGYQMSKIPNLSFQEMLEYTTKGNENAIITVGVIKNGEISYKVYGEDGKEIEHELHTYEIGSLTKTFTAAMINQAIQDEKIEIDATIDQYLSLPEGNFYPTIKELLTHTSGYKSYYFEKPMISNFLKRRNDFYEITGEMVLNKTKKIEAVDQNNKFHYSNYGYAILGQILQSVYGLDYTTLVNQFAQEKLNLSNTNISNEKGDLENYWDWGENDAYLSAGALTSNVEDMLLYAQMQLDDMEPFEQCHNSINEINASTDSYKKMGIYMDEIGMAWVIDKENSIIWHNGGTDDYNCYLGFNKDNQTAVIVLSNLPLNYRIPATVMGVKLLQK